MSPTLVTASRRNAMPPASPALLLRRSGLIGREVGTRHCAAAPLAAEPPPNDSRLLPPNASRVPPVEAPVAVVTLCYGLTDIARHVTACHVTHETWSKSVG
jgi:hypothetical protein